MVGTGAQRNPGHGGQKQVLTEQILSTDDVGFTWQKTGEGWVQATQGPEVPGRTTGLDSIL